MERINPNAWHPYARYGVAVAVVELKRFNAELDNSDVLYELAEEALLKSLNYYLLHSSDLGLLNELTYNYVHKDDLDNAFPISKDYLLSPHVLTTSTNNGKGCFDKILNDVVDKKGKTTYTSIINALRKRAEGEYDLYQSFAPLVTKIRNEGQGSSTNPKASLLEVAFTALTTITQLKPSIHSRIQHKGTDKKPVWANHGIIPDLPLWEGNEKPLIRFVDIFYEISETSQGNALTAKKVGKINRPNIYWGNYPNASKLSSGPLGVLSLVAGIGAWARNTVYYKDEASENWASKVLFSIQKAPIYIVSDEGSFQESFNNHLISLTLQEDLTTIALAFSKVRLFGDEEEAKKKGKNSKNSTKETTFEKSPKKEAFLLIAERFLRLYTPESFKNFISFRATYPIELTNLFKHYFMNNHHSTISADIIQSARDYGSSLSYAAFLAAQQDHKRDPDRTIEAYKERYITQIESTIASASARNGVCDLMARLGTVSGRLAEKNVISLEGSYQFIEAALSEKITFENVKNLIIVFIRLNTAPRNQ